MSFFVLLLSFTDVDLSRFQLMSGSLSEAFRTQRFVPVVGEPALRADKDANGRKSAAGEAAGLIPLNGRQSSEGVNRPTDAADFARLLGQALVEGRVEIVRLGESLALHFTALESNARDPLGLKQTTVDALENIARLSMAPQSAASQIASPITAPDPKAAAAIATESAKSEFSPDDSADKAFHALTEALKTDLNDGSVRLVRGQNRVVVQIGTAGAFALGSADLTSSARELIQRIGRISLVDDPELIVAGHTDNIPISTERFHDNWELASARAISVVKELQKTAGMTASLLSVRSFGDLRPIAPNDSAENREKNRRVEIELQYH